MDKRTRVETNTGYRLFENLVDVVVWVQSGQKIPIFMSVCKKRQSQRQILGVKPNIELHFNYDC